MNVKTIFVIKFLLTGYITCKEKRKCFRKQEIEKQQHRFRQFMYALKIPTRNVGKKGKSTKKIPAKFAVKIFRKFRGNKLLKDG